jgi:hypothetical protein
MHEITYDLADRPNSVRRASAKAAFGQQRKRYGPVVKRKFAAGESRPTVRLEVGWLHHVRYPRPVLAALECRAVRQLPRQATACAPSPRGCLPPEKGMTITC